MNNMLLQFKENAPIRMQVIKGEPWFVAKDVCDTLSIYNSRDAVGRLDNDEKGVGNTDTPGGNQEVALVNESGLYALVFQSRKPAAQEFRKWVTSEVLPSIRKYGKYVVPDSKEQLRLENNLKRKERRSWLNSISNYLTYTDIEDIARKYRCDTVEISQILDDRRTDTTLEFECVTRATRNAKLRRLLDDSEFRAKIIQELRGRS